MLEPPLSDDLASTRPERAASMPPFELASGAPQVSEANTAPGDNCVRGDHLTVTLVYPSVLDRARTRHLLEEERALMENAPASLPNCQGGERVDTAKLEQAGVPLDAIADYIQDVRGRLCDLSGPTSHRNPSQAISSWLRPRVLLFLSPDRSLQEQHRMIAVIQAQFQRVYRRTAVIIPKYLDPLRSSTEEVDAVCAQTVQQVLQQEDGKQPPEMQDLADSLRETTQRMHAEMGLYAHATRPVVTEKIIMRIAAIRAAMEVANRIIQAMRLEPIASEHLLAPLVKSVVLACAGASAEYFWIAYFFTWQAWIEKVQISSASIRRVLDRVDTLLGPPEKNRARRACKAAKLLAVNVALNGLARPLAMQDCAAWLYGTDYADLGDCRDLLANGLLGVSFFTGGYLGAHWLRQKGWISETELKLSFLCLGMLDVASNFFNSDRSLRHLRIFSQGPQWATYAIIALLSLVLPERRGRFVVIDDAVCHRRSEIDALASTEQNFRLKRGRDVLRRFVEKSQSLPNVKRGGHRLG